MAYKSCLLAGFPVVSLTVFTCTALINILNETIVQLRRLHGVAAMGLYPFTYKSACSQLARSTGTLAATLIHAIVPLGQLPASRATF